MPAPQLDGPQNRYWLARLDAERDNIRSGMRWAIRADEAETVVRISAPLSHYWWTRGLLAQMLAFAEETAGLPSAADLPADAQALLLWSQGTIRIALGRVEEAVPYLRRLSDAAGAIGDERLRAHSMASLALTLPYETGAAEARSLMDEALRIFRHTGDRWGVAFVLTPLGHMALRDGNAAGATAMHTESLAAAEEIDNDHLRAQALNQLGLDALVAGDVPAARRWLARSAEVNRRLLYDEGISYCLDEYAGLALALNRPEVAARLAGAAAHTREVVGVAIYPLLRPLADTLAAAVRAGLDPETFAREWAAGAAMRPGDALDRAVDLTAPEPVSAVGG